MVKVVILESGEIFEYDKLVLVIGLYLFVLLILGND